MNVSQAAKFKRLNLQDLREIKRRTMRKDFNMMSKSKKAREFHEKKL